MYILYNPKRYHSRIKISMKTSTLTTYKIFILFLIHRYAINIPTRSLYTTIADLPYNYNLQGRDKKQYLFKDKGRSVATVRHKSGKKNSNFNFMREHFHQWRTQLGARGGSGTPNLKKINQI